MEGRYVTKTVHSLRSGRLTQSVTVTYCKDCGSVVHETTTHDSWHLLLDSILDSVR